MRLSEKWYGLDGDNNYISHDIIMKLWNWENDREQIKFKIKWPQKIEKPGPTTHTNTQYLELDNSGYSPAIIEFEFA